MKGKKIFMDVPFLDVGKKLHGPLTKTSPVRVLTMRIVWSVSANYTCWIAFYFYTSPFTKMLFHLFRFVQKHVQSKKKWKNSRMCLPKCFSLLLNLALAFVFPQRWKYPCIFAEEHRDPHGEESRQTGCWWSLFQPSLSFLSFCKL